MKVDVTGGAFSLAEVVFEQAGETLFAAPGSMVSMAGGVQLKVSLGGGLVRPLSRRMADQTSIMVKYTADEPGASVMVAPEDPGAVAALDLATTGPLRVTAGALLAYQDSIQVSTRITGISRAAMSGSATVLGARGAGKLLVAASGALKPLNLAAGERAVVDTGHLVCWSEDIGLRFGPVGGLARAGLSDEGFVGEFTGPGTLLIQTRKRIPRRRRR